MTEIFDYVAIGIGPANLSLAALAAGRGDVRGVHVERAERFAWHPGIMLPGATLQVSHLKDLVTPVDPTNPYSFLAFLVAEGRFYEFVTARFQAAHRAEFDQYLRWAAGRVPGLRFGRNANRVVFGDGCFEVSTGREVLRGRNLVLGTGQELAVPAPFRGRLSRDVFHASEFLTHDTSLTGRHVAVVGGGQSGAEVVRHLLTVPAGPRQISWISRRPGLLPLDDSAFTNDLFRPEAVRGFFAQSDEQRARRLDDEKYASDGIDERLLTEIYQLNYMATHVEGRPDRLCVLAGREVVRCTSSSSGGSRLRLKGADGFTEIEADKVVLATGYTQRLSSCLDSLTPGLRLQNDLPVMREDFSVEWGGPAAHRIYLQNGARHAFGIADPNLSLLAWRSHVILNSIRPDRSGNDDEQTPPAFDGGRVPATRGRRDRDREFAG